MSKLKEQILKEESRLSLNERLLTTSLVAWLTGKEVNVKFRGSRNEIAAISNALLSSKQLQEELNRPDATIASVMEKLHIKQTSAAEFERVLRIPWPL